MATNGMDLGAVSMMIYGWREREEVLRFFQEVTGLRMNHNYIRPGGRRRRPPGGMARRCAADLLDMLPPRLDEYDTLMTGQPIWRERLQGVGVITPNEALALGATGPIVRSTGVAVGSAARHARTCATTSSSSTSSSAPMATAFDRYAIRLAEIRESMETRAPDRRPDARRKVTTGSRTRRSRRRLGPASTSRWRR